MQHNALHKVRSYVNPSISCSPLKKTNSKQLLKIIGCLPLLVPIVNELCLGNTAFVIGEHMKIKFADVCDIFVYCKNYSCYRHVQYICIGKTIKSYIDCCVLPSSSLFSNFPDMVHVE